MHKLDQKTIACAVFTMVLFGSLTARIETASAQGFEGTRLAQALTAKQQKLKDTLTGRTRSVVLGPPVKRHRQQKRRIQEIIRKNTTRAPALPGPSLPRPDPSSAAPRDQARPGGVEFSAEPVEVDEPVAPVQHMTKADREDIKKITDDNKLPAVNVEIYFKYNSAEINPRSYPALISLGQVLVEPELKGLTFLVAGYTDAKGGQRYNQSLSERRARTVQTFLQRTFKIAATRLLPVGYGEEHLKNSSDPYAAENRRVQIVNLSAIK